MTVIAAVASGGRVVMGCDTATDCGGTAIYSTRGKIGRFQTADGELVLIGAAGNAAIVPTLQRDLTIDHSPRGRGRATADRWASGLAESITRALAAAHPPLLSTNGDGTAASVDGSLLVAWRHCLWLIYTHAALRPHNGVAALGSGRDIALGSMHTAMATGTDRWTAVDQAVRWASKFDSGCGIDERGPLLFITDGQDWTD